jgi:hypothetical protein
MKAERERSPGTSRWTVETTGSIDRAIALVIVFAVLALAHVAGLDGGLLGLAEHLF